MIETTTGINSLEPARTGNVFQQSLGGEEFLQLLVAQLQNQDPLSPMESQQFASELAQFSSLEKLVNIDGRLEDSINSDYILTQAINNTLASTLLGKEVTALGNRFALQSGEPASLAFRLGDAADTVNVIIVDSTGREVRKIPAGGMGAGQHDLQWDGLGADGRQMPPGSYSFRVEAVGADGQTINTIPMIKGIISSVRYENGAAILVVNGGDVAFSDVLELGGQP